MQSQLTEDDNIPLSPVIKPTPYEVHACRFSSWYSTFRDMRLPDDTRKHRKNVTIESTIISPLPPEFIRYLLSDGVRLPDCAKKVSSCMNDADENADDEWDSPGEDDDEEEEKFSFPSLTEEIQATINALGGDANKGCMPKLNWSSPKDASWINQSTLKCTKAGDVYLLLKSSEFVAFDLERAWKDVENDVASDMETLSFANKDEQKFELVLRKWCNLHPSMEFRCFIYDHEIVAISQRHPSKYYSHLQPPSEDDDHPLLAIIEKFYKKYVKGRFTNGKIHRYVLDLYIDSQQRTWIVDFNVWGSRTDGLLFDWEELTKLGLDASSAKNDRLEVEPEFRVVTKDMKSMTYDPLSSFRGPTDVMDLLGQGNGDNDGFDGSSFENFMKQCVRPSEM
ncbi:hypothetical protein ACHAXN_010094 [Cyclotella atomus]